MIKAGELDMLARAMIEMFADEAPARAASMVDEKSMVGDLEGKAFWSKFELRIQETLNAG